MKKWKFVAMALSLSLLFTACSSSDDDDKNTSSTNSNGVVEDVVSDIGDGTNDVLSDVNDVVSDVISGTEDVVSDITHGDDDKTDSDLNSGDTTSKTAALPAAGSLENVSVNEAELQEIMLPMDGGRVKMWTMQIVPHLALLFRNSMEYMPHSLSGMNKRKFT